jgi:hypothetical protein
VLAFVASFLSYYTVSVAYVSDSTTAWHGFFGWFGAVLAAAGAVVIALGPIAARASLPVPPDTVALALFALGATSTFAAVFTSGYANSRVPGADAESGHGYAYWLSLGAVCSAALLAAVRVRAARAVSVRDQRGTLGCEPSGTGKPGEGDST